MPNENCRPFLDPLDGLFGLADIFRHDSEFAGIRLPQTLADVIHLPAMNIQIRLNRCIDNIASIPVE
jgi:hypothetical protein